MMHITLTELAIGLATILVLGVALIVVHKQETQVVVPAFGKPQCVDTTPTRTPTGWNI